MNLYEVIENYGSNQVCVLNMAGAFITFGCDDVRISSVGEVEIGTFPKIRISNYVKFVLNKENEEWYHFNDCNTSTFTLSIKK